jgi:hypothetical protein
MYYTLLHKEGRRGRSTCDFWAGFQVASLRRTMREHAWAARNGSRRGGRNFPLSSLTLHRPASTSLLASGRPAFEWPTAPHFPSAPSSPPPRVVASARDVLVDERWGGLLKPSHGHAPGRDGTEARPGHQGDDKQKTLPVRPGTIEPSPKSRFGSGPEAHLGKAVLVR